VGHGLWGMGHEKWQQHRPTAEEMKLNFIITIHNNRVRAASQVSSFVLIFRHDGVLRKKESGYAARKVNCSGSQTAQNYGESKYKS